MKKTITQRFFLSLCLMIVGCLWGSSAWAETVTYQHVFSTKPSTGNGITLSNVTWDFTATNLNNFQSTYQGVQIGTKSLAGEFKLTSSSSWNYNGKTKITEIRLWLNTGGQTVTPTVTIGGKTATSDGTTITKKSNISSWSAANKVTFTPAADGNTGVVVIDVTSVKAGYICALEIDCEEAATKTLSSVVVTGKPTKIIYEAGDKFEPAGLVVKGTYSYGSTETFTEDIAWEDITWKCNHETLTEGLTSVTVTATVDGVTSPQFEVTGLTVNAARTLSSVTLEGTPTKTTYIVGEIFNPTGIIVKANYSTGESEDVTAEATFTYDENALTFGTTQAQVFATYKDKDTDVQSYSITVNKKASSISIANLVLGVGDASTITATTTPADATLSYSITDGSEYVTLDGNQITATALGTATIKATYAGNDEYEAAETTFTVTVSNLKTATITSFSEISGYFTDNTDISYAADKGGGTAGPAITNGNLVLYQISSGKSFGGYVTIQAVNGAKIQSVKLTTGGAYTSTTVGYKVDDEAAPTTGVSISENTSYTISDLDNQSVTIYCLATDKKYRLAIASLEVKYTKEDITLTDIALGGEYQTAFTQYDDFNHDDLVVTATYSDGSSKDVTEVASISTPDMSTVGTKTVTVSYTEDGVTKEASYDITVSKKIFSEIEVKTVYRKVTSTADVVDGGVYLIVCEEMNEAMGVTNSSKSRCESQEVTLSDYTYTKKVNQDGSPYEITISKATDGNGYYNLYHAAGDYINATENDANLNFGATGDNGWSISFDESSNVIINNIKAPGYHIQRNNSSNNFYKNYADLYTGGIAIQLYQKVGEISVAKATGGITTFASNYDYIMPEHLTGYVVIAAKEEGTITTKVAYVAGKEVPAYTPLIIKSNEEYAETDNSKTYTPVALNKGLSYTGAENMLEYTRDENGFTKTSKDESVYYYKLAIKNGNVGFYWGATDGAAFEMKKPSTAYLTVPKTMPVQGFVLNLEEGEPTGIATVATDENAPIYNLQGIRMNGKNLPKGIYIQGGKKFMVK